MKKIYLVLIFVTIIINMYLIFMWNPSVNSIDVAVSSYESMGNILDNNLDKNDTMSHLNNDKQKDNNILEKELLYSNQGELLENLNDKDIQDINKILNKLSTSDLSKWSELKNEEDNDKIIEFFKLMNRRMSKEDYDKIKKIMGKILDIDIIESIIENNYV